MLLISVAGLTGDQAGEWFAFPSEPSSEVPAVVTLSAGTGTVIIEGRNTPSDAPVQLDSRAASGGGLILRFPQMRARIVSGSNVTAQVSVSSPYGRPV